MRICSASAPGSSAATGSGRGVGEGVAVGTGVGVGVAVGDGATDVGTGGVGEAIAAGVAQPVTIARTIAVDALDHRTLIRPLYSARPGACGDARSHGRVPGDLLLDAHVPAREETDEHHNWKQEDQQPRGDALEV